LEIKKDYPIGELTTFKIGGNAQYFCTPQNLTEVIESLQFTQDGNFPLYILGGGANILVADTGVEGLVLSTQKLDKVEIKDNLVSCECGILINDLNKILINSSLSGMEFSGGLPGSIGGAVFMNARCYGKEFSDIVESVVVLNENFKEEILTKKDLDYSYKNSVFMRRDKLFIYKVNLKLEYGNKQEIEALYQKNAVDRTQKGQFEYPSAGCAFKNDYSFGISTGKIIDELNLKGISIGGAEVYLKHGNFIINKNNATASDVVKLIELVEKEVYEKKGIKLEREVRLIGF